MHFERGFRRKFEKGDIFTKYKNFMGYDYVDGEIVIVPEQAEVVRKMSELYLQGLSLGQIKAYLESHGIKTATGKGIWDTKTIQNMLKNEKYKGDTLLQKTFTEDFMTGKKSKNIGQRNKYCVKNSHPAIVSAEVFDKVLSCPPKNRTFYSYILTNSQCYSLFRSYPWGPALGPAPNPVLAGGQAVCCQTAKQ